MSICKKCGRVIVETDVCLCRKCRNGEKTNVFYFVKKTIHVIKQFLNRLIHLLNII